MLLNWITCTLFISNHFHYFALNTEFLIEHFVLIVYNHIRCFLGSFPLEKRSCGVDDRHLNWLDLRESQHHVQVISRCIHSIAVTLAPIFNMVNLTRNFFFVNMLLVLLWFVFLNTVWIPFKLGGSTSRLYYLRKKNHASDRLEGRVIEPKSQNIKPYREILCNTLHEPIRPIL